jgi:hypothetical protein
MKIGESNDPQVLGRSVGLQKSMGRILRIGVVRKGSGAVIGRAGARSFIYVNGCMSSKPSGIVGGSIDKWCDVVATLFEQRQAGTVTGEELVALVDGTCSGIERREALNKRRERGPGGESGHGPTKDGKRRRCSVQTRRGIATARRKRAREVRIVR